MKKTIRPAKPKSARELLALNLRLLRVRKNVTQEQLAHDARVNPGYISQIETGTRAVSIDIVERLALSLGVTVAALLTDN